jgi:hypothetical protein
MRALGGVNVPYPMVGWGDAAGDRIRALKYSYSKVGSSRRQVLNRGGGRKDNPATPAKRAGHIPPSMYHRRLAKIQSVV